MIYIHRPEEIYYRHQRHRAWQRQERDIHDYAQLSPEERQHRRLPGQRNPGDIPAFRQDIREIFYNKCVFCESPLAETAEVTRYRPAGYARHDHTRLPINDRQDKEHYYWLAWQWSNLYIACPTCINNKERVFPVQASRANSGTVDVEVLYDSEQPLLLDPCRDNPAIHLEFHDDGHITAKQGSERGAATINILQLNRIELVQARREAAENLKQLLDVSLNAEEVSHDDTQCIIEQLQSACQSSQPFAGLKRQLLRDRLESSKRVSAKTTRMLEGPLWTNLIHQLDEWLSEGITKKKPMTIFISYSHKDEAEKDFIIRHLSVLVSRNRIKLWSDDQLKAGNLYKEVIEKQIRESKIIILLITKDFLNSEFIFDIELPLIRRLHQSGDLEVVPVIARDCYWKCTDWIKDLHVRPNQGKPVWREDGRFADHELAVIVEEVAKMLRGEK